MDLSDDMQAQAKALADPSRFKLFRHIANAAASVTVAELTDLLGFNHNAVRQHLAVLTHAGLIAEDTEKRTSRGRPRKLYTLRADALRAFGSVSGSYQSLAELLLELTSSGDDPYDVGYRVAQGRAIRSVDDPADAMSELAQQLGAEGFEPTMRANGVITLQHCPFADVAAKNPSVICELHRGLIDGYLSAQEPAVVGELTLRDPHRGGCTVVLHSTSTGASA